MVYNLIVCGGTFDHFHKGHEAFLSYVFSVGKKVIVGVTSDEFIKSEKRKAKNEKQIESFEKRKQAVLGFVKSEGVLGRAEIVKIDDLFGPTLSKDLQINAIVVSDDTKKGAGIINRKRKELSLAPLKVFIVPPVKAEDEKLISSARIRNGEINRAGKLYVRPAWLETDLVLPQDLRGQLQEPFGELLLDINGLSKAKDDLIITVGDITTKVFNERSLGQNLSVIDFKVERKQRFSGITDLGFSEYEKVVKVDNPAGFITKNLFRKLSEILAKDIKRTIVQINGEEDLAVLPLVLLSPLNTTIYYGQPHKGLVKVKVSEESKNKAYSLVSKLKRA